MLIDVSSKSMRPLCTCEIIEQRSRMFAMEPTDINGGRFYARPLHNDDRIDDTPAIRLIDAHFDVDEAHHRWHDNSMYSWAVCEQTNIDMIALAVLHLTSTEHGLSGILDIAPAGDPARELPNDPILDQKTVGDGVHEIRGPIERWCTAHGITLTR